MNCETAKILLEDYIDGKLTGADTGFITAHLQTCAACREDYRRTVDMLALLKDIPVPPASPGFAERALKNATRAQPVTAGRRFTRLAGGIAAGLVGLLLLTSLLTQQSQVPAEPAVVLIGDEVKTIRVAIESARAIDGITVAIDVSDNLEIDGYRDRRALSWTTRLEEGVNLIALPVTAIAEGDGEIVTRVGLGDGEKVFRIRTRHQDSGNAGRNAPALAARLDASLGEQS